MFTNSVCSYPSRGPYGNNQYRGNCSGFIIKDFIESFLPKGGLFVDPSVGGGTSNDVANALNIRFKGFDLHSGFNLLVDDLAARSGELADVCFWHPPYADMIQYSAVQWGDTAHPHDLSQMSLKNFVDGMMLAIANIHDATKVGGYYGILCGNQRKKGSYRNLSSLVERLAPGQLTDEIIKTQHNCVSDRRNYSNKSLIRISHEKLLIFRKVEHSSYFAVKQAENKAMALLDATWLTTLRRMLQQKSSMDLNSILTEFGSLIDVNNFLNVNWEARIESLLKSEHFEFLPDSGNYSLCRY